MKAKLLLIVGVLIFTNSIIAQQIEVLSDTLFNGTEGIIYDQVNNQYFVGNATDGKLLTIDSENNVEIFKESIGADMLMAFEIVGDSLFVSTNYPRTLTCLNKNTGDSIYQLVLDTIANSLAVMAYDNETGYLYLADQTGKVLKADAHNATCNVFASGISSGCNTIVLDKPNNRLLVFSYSTSRIKFINLIDSTDITDGPLNMSGQNVCSEMDNDGYVYVSTWVGNNIKKMHIDSLDEVSFFCKDSLNRPVGIAFNSADNKIAVCNYGNSTITIIDKEYSPEGIKSGEKKIENLKITYNSSLQKVDILFPALISPHEVNIFDLTGRVVKSKKLEAGENRFEIETSGIYSGVYVVSIKGDQGFCASKKIIIM